MGNKIDAKGFRIGVSHDWKSNWFANKNNYGDYVVQDAKIRDFIRNRLKKARVEDINIERSINEIRITIKTARPGMVIGKGGAGVELLREELAKFVDSNISITVEEVKKPELSARLIADKIAYQIEKRVHYKRAVLSAISRAKDQGATGIKITVSGVLSGANSISRTETFHDEKEGSVPLSTLRVGLDYAEEVAVTQGGTIGIKVWVNKESKKE